jgi:iron-sulfur cluster assembly accessory protein
MINLSKAAAEEIRRLQLRRQKTQARLRLGVEPGGCAAFYYMLDFDESINPGDRIYECDGIPVIVNQESLNYIRGLTLDYSEDLMGGGFRFYNPNSIESCGCGNSFRVERAVMN